MMDSFTRYVHQIRTKLQVISKTCTERLFNLASIISSYIKFDLVMFGFYTITWQKKLRRIFALSVGRVTICIIQEQKQEESLCRQGMLFSVLFRL